MDDATKPASPAAQLAPVSSLGLLAGFCPKVLFGPPAPGDLAMIDIPLVSQPDAPTATTSIAPSSTLGSAVAAAASRRSATLRSGRDQLGVLELGSA